MSLNQWIISQRLSARAPLAGVRRRLRHSQRQQGQGVRAAYRLVRRHQWRVAVGLLHAGSSYADDLDEDGVLYHDPSTKRNPGRDEAVVEAT